MATRDRAAYMRDYRKKAPADATPDGARTKTSTGMAARIAELELEVVNLKRQLAARATPVPVNAIGGPATATPRGVEPGFGRSYPAPKPGKRG